jgi:hypothetical protein
MSAIETGKYIVTFFDNRGGKLRDIEEIGDRIVDCRKLGALVVSLKNNNAVSFYIDRRIFNSLDIKGAEF